MSYPSRLLGRIQFLFVAIFLLFAIVALLNQFSFDIFTEFYYEHLSTFDGVITSYKNEFLIIAIISLLLWLLRVHSALRRIHPQYPINEVEYLLRMVLPLVQLWGIASTFYQLSVYFANNPRIAKKANKIQYIAVFFYLYMFGGILFALLADDVWSETNVMYIGLLAMVAFYSMLLIFTHWINQYVYICVQDAPILVKTPAQIWSPMLESTLTYTPHNNERADIFLPQFVQASIGARFAAKSIEFVLFIIITVAAIIPGAISDDSNQMLMNMLIAWLGWFIYVAIHLSMKGQTIGKWLLGIKIVRVDSGAEGGFIHNVLLRVVANQVIGWLIPLYSIVDILFIFSGDARCIHDKIAGTRVISTRPTKGQ